MYNFGLKDFLKFNCRKSKPTLNPTRIECILPDLNSAGLRPVSPGGKVCGHPGGGS